MATDDEIRKIVCRGCYAVLDAGDKFCRHCGQRVAGADAEPAAGADPVPAQLVVEPPAARSNWSQSRWFVLAMLFVVLGPLAIPMLWRSRRFSVPWKIVLTLLVAILTVAVLWLVWYVVDKTIVEPLKQLKEMRQF